jgi:DNA-directed RNA polymerase subunit RPC12/RpoP
MAIAEYHNGMRLKLDLHPIYNDTARIESELHRVIDEAVAKRVDEVEIIPGKGSGALKKTVLRFLDRPEIKARYHRFEKDGDNWGRLFVHFKHGRWQEPRPNAAPDVTSDYVCFCCQAAVAVVVDPEALKEDGPEVRIAECPSCGSPNKLTIGCNRRGDIRIAAKSGYEEE